MKFRHILYWLIIGSIISIVGCTKHIDAEDITPEQPLLEKIDSPELKLDSTSLSHLGFTVEWDIIDNSEHCIYSLRESSSPLSPINSGKTKECYITFTDLKPETKYTLKVRATSININLYESSDWTTLEIQTLKKEVPTPEEPEIPDQPNAPEIPSDWGNQLSISYENIAHDWQLAAITTNGVEIISGGNVYISLNENGQFELYQVNLNYPGIVKFDGTYTLNIEEGIISGVYSDGIEWGNSYTIAQLYEKVMVWQQGNEESTYVRINSIPDYIADNAIQAQLTRMDKCVRFL